MASPTHICHTADEGVSGFICPDCKYLSLSPESLLGHFNHRHPAMAKVASDTISTQQATRQLIGGGIRGRSSSFGLIFDPIINTLQQTQLNKASAFTMFLNHATINKLVPSDINQIIHSFAREDAYSYYINFRTSLDYTKGIWLTSRIQQFKKMQSVYQKDHILARSMIRLGIHPKSTMSYEMMDLSQSSEIDKIAIRTFTDLCRFSGSDVLKGVRFDDYKTPLMCISDFIAVRNMYGGEVMGNELFAQCFKQLNFNFGSVCQVNKWQENILPSSTNDNDDDDDDDDNEEGDISSWWFIEMLAAERVHLMEICKSGCVKYWQALYCLCLTTLPSVDFLPFIRRHLKDFANGTTNNNNLNECIWNHQVIRSYALCSLHALDENVKNTNENRGGGREVVLSKLQVSAIMTRPPLFVKVHLPGEREGGDTAMYHVKPWETSSSLAIRVLDDLNIDGYEADSCSLYIKFENQPPPPPSSTTAPFSLSALASTQTTEEEEEEKIFASNLHTSRKHPAFVPSTFFISLLTACKFNYKLLLLRKHLFGCKYFKISPVANIQIKRRLETNGYLKDEECTKSGNGLLYFQTVGEFMGGNHFVVGADSGRFMSVGDVCVIERVYTDLFSKDKFSKDEFSEDEDEDEQTNETNEADKTMIIYKLNALLATAIFLRTLKPNPPIKGLKWTYAKENSVLGLGGQIEKSIEWLPLTIMSKQPKLFWNKEIEWILSNTVISEMNDEELEDLVLTAVGVEYLFGSHWFFVDLTFVDPSFFGPEFEFSKQFEDMGLASCPIWFAINARGFHLVTTDNIRMKTIEFEKILRWSGLGDTIEISIVADTGVKAVKADGSFGTKSTKSKSVEIKGKCTRGAALKAFLLESIHSLMSHQAFSNRGAKPRDSSDIVVQDEVVEMMEEREREEMAEEDGDGGYGEVIGRRRTTTEVLDEFEVTTTTTTTALQIKNLRLSDGRDSSE